MKTYELTYIISPDGGSATAETTSKGIESAIQAHEGVIIKQANPVVKTLSQQINKHASGFFGVFEFQVEPEQVEEIKKQIEKDEKIIRQMLIIKKPANMRKARRTKKPTEATAEISKPASKENEPVMATPEKESKKNTDNKTKVELKDIEEQLEEILG